MDGVMWTWVVVWIALVLVFLVVEVFTLDFVFVMLAAGSAGGLVASLLGLPWWASVLIAAALSLLLIALVRPRVIHALGRGADPHRTNVDALTGMSGEVVVAFTASAPGQVRLANGETWSARIAADTGAAVPVRPPLGTPVVVTGVEGSTAVVRLTERTTP
ncbi:MULTISPECIES: NfeD family protein [unclassified Curtobacterium]|uniref:NfeD family protein n=1 Tax=unclassified Curtobacterium TaxID=257496 RepID=UPI0011B7E052|nr:MULTISPECIES: NfeD family protein [unclassified Curtobacterium]